MIFNGEIMNVEMQLIGTSHPNNLCDGTYRSILLLLVYSVFKCWKLSFLDLVPK